MAFKRAARSTFRGRRNVRRRLNFRGRRPFARKRRSTYTASTRTLRAGNPFAMRAKRMRKRNYRSLLWRSSILDPHFRSIFSNVSSRVTSTGLLNQTIFTDECMASTIGQEFWRTAGGLQDINYGQTMPWAIGTDNPSSIVIRGGRLWCSYANNSTDDVRIRIQLVFVKQQFRSQNDGAQSNTLSSWVSDILATPKPISWAMQDAPDYSEYLYRPVLDKTIVLRNGENSEIYWKIKPAKIDPTAFERAGGWFPIWISYLSGSLQIAEDTVSFQWGHNISFAAGPTTL